MNRRLGAAALAAGVLVTGTAVGYRHFADILPRGAPTADAPLAPDQEAATAESEAAGDPPGERVATVASGDAATAPANLAPEPTAPMPATTIAPAATENEAPAFELLRVEPDGSAVVAGRAAPGSQVVLRNGGAVLARETANGSGEFAIVLDEPLPPGSHVLRLETEGEDGASVLSAETAIVAVPEPGREEELLVALEAPDRPTEFLTVPDARLGAGGGGEAGRPSAAVPDTSPASGETELAAASPAAAPPGPAPTESVAEASPDGARVASQSGSTAATTAGLGIAAVEIEDRQLFIAGTARPGATIRLYLDDELVGETATGAGDRFIAEALRDVPVGSHTVRADEVGADGTVLSRAEVPFDRPAGASVAARAPDPGTTDRQGETAAAADPAVAAFKPATVAPAGPNEPNEPQAAPADAASSIETADLRLQPALEPVEGRVLIRRGDTLWRISRDTYGRGSRYTVIYLANGAQIRDPDLIYPGQVFRLPDEEEPGADGDASRPG